MSVPTLVWKHRKNLTFDVFAPKLQALREKRSEDPLGQHHPSPQCPCQIYGWWFLLPAKRKHSMVHLRI